VPSPFQLAAWSPGDDGLNAFMLRLLTTRTSRYQKYRPTGRVWQ